MQIRHLRTIISAGDAVNRVTAICWSSNNQKLAVAGADRVVALHDETGEKKDKFSTKPADPKSGRNYVICAMAFSPDSTKLAVAQTDCVVFVYKLGLEWGEKKSICNKFVQTADITCLTWPREQHNALVFGMVDGKVRVGNLKSNKAATLYQTESLVVSAASSPDGNAFVTGHLDGSIYRFFFDDGVSGVSQGKLAAHRYIPYALAWGESVVAAGSERIVTFYNSEGKISQEFDYSKEEEDQEFTIAEFSPSGQSVVIGGFGKLRIYDYSQQRASWDETPTKHIENFYTVTALSWKPDGSRLVAGNLTGAVEMFDCCLRRSRYMGKFEFTYVSPSQVIVKRLSNGSRIVLKSHYGYEIQKINIFKDQFLIANTPETLLMGDLASCKLSEVPWRGVGNEKFYFENPYACMVFNAGELSLVEYGVNEVLGSCRTEHMNPHMISVRLNERNPAKEVKRIAYLVDLQTIHVLDLITGVIVATVNHDSHVDWLELSGRGDRLLFRDRRRVLHLYDIENGVRNTLLNYCSYVQWVPNSDVVVAQNRRNLCIWYSIESPERITMFPIKGDVEDIERADGKTEVIVDEGVNTVSYTLDEGLIEFGAAVDDGDYERAVSLLESLEMTSETEAMWKTLSNAALKKSQLVVAKRCFAALGDVAKAKYISDLNDLAERITEEGMGNPMDHYLIRAKLAVLDKQFKLAESIYLEQGKVEEAMRMYQEMHKWDLSIRVAELKSHPELETLRRNYYQWLLDSGQEEKAGELKEAEGDIISAINLYLKGGMPARAATLLNQYGLSSNVELTERIAGALFKAGLFEKAGEFFERLGNLHRALEAYKRGKAYRPAVELCRMAFPNEVVPLEEQWGDHLVAHKQLDAAVNHYIEAGRMLKALEAAIGARQWKKAAGIVDSLQPPEQARPYCRKLAEHFETVSDYANAEKYYINAGLPQNAVDMYIKANRWDKAHSLAVNCMSRDEVAVLYITEAKELQAKGIYKEAEKLYITVDEPDLAINMYKNAKQYDQMIRLVTVHHKDLLVETHLYLGKTLEAEGSFKQAEHHYVEGQDWKAAVNMYCANNMFEEAYRAAKAYGGTTTAKQIAYLWARSLGGESAMKLLTKLGLLESVIDLAVENGTFEFAYELARNADKSKLADVHYKHAMFLEDEGKFKEAEQAFIAAGKPKEAILMYIHGENWDAAQTVAETHDPASVSEVLIGQAKLALEKKDFAKVESFLLRAQRPELAVKFYQDEGMWKEALRFATEYLPSKLAEVQAAYDKITESSKPNLLAEKEDFVTLAKRLEQQKEYSRAIDTYLKSSVEQTADLDKLETYWEKAVELSMKFVPERGQEVVTKVCERLIGIRRYETAAELYAGVEMYKEAMDAYLMGEHWEKAKAIVALAPKLTPHFEAAYKRSLRRAGQADALANVDATEALNLYAQRGEWDKCLQTAAEQGTEILNQYLGVRAAQLIKSDKPEEAAMVYIKYGLPMAPEHFEVYSRIQRMILQSGNLVHIATAREMLYKLVQSGAGMEIPEEFTTGLFVMHVLGLKEYCSKNPDLVYFAAKQAVSLLRYTNMILVDRTFYEAGMACRAANINNVAFICLNRFLDIVEAMEEGDLASLENTDFTNTDVPFPEVLPRTSSVPEAKREEAREWVLAVSLDQKVSQELPTRECDACNKRIYEASLTCYNCGNRSEPCIVTGYPLLRSKVKCSSCGRYANKDDWNRFVMSQKLCPWCGTSATASYSLQK